MNSTPSRPEASPTKPIRLVSVICWDASFRDTFDALECLLHQTLPRERFEVIFVEYYRDVNPAVRDYAARCDNIRILTVGHEHPGRENEHRIGVCVNEGLRHARGDLVVVPDADVRFEADFLEEAVRQHQAFANLALYFYRLDEPPTEEPAPRTAEALKAVCKLANPSNHGGCLSVRRRWLLAINGYEEHPITQGYSAVGLDTASRLKTLGLAIKWHPSKFLYHGCHAGTQRPGPESAARRRTYKAIITQRMRELETLPLFGLDPHVKPNWPPGGQLPDTIDKSAPAKRHWLGTLVRRALPRSLRRRIGSMLTD